MVEVKVPVIFFGTEGFSAHRDGRYVTFFNYFSLRRPLSNKKKTAVNHTVDCFNHATDRRFGCSPLLNRDH
jgi:hypothetical protein